MSKGPNGIAIRKGTIKLRTQNHEPMGTFCWHKNNRTDPKRFVQQFALRPAYCGRAETE